MSASSLPPLDPALFPPLYAPGSAPLPVDWEEKYRHLRCSVDTIIQSADTPMSKIARLFALMNREYTGART